MPTTTIVNWKDVSCSLAKEHWEFIKKVWQGHLDHKRVVTFSSLTSSSSVGIQDFPRRRQLYPLAITMFKSAIQVRILHEKLLPWKICIIFSPPSSWRSMHSETRFRILQPSGGVHYSRGGPGIFLPRWVYGGGTRHRSDHSYNLRSQ